MKELTHLEFIESLKEGKKVRRTSWPSNNYIKSVYYSSAPHKSYFKDVIVKTDGTTVQVEDYVLTPDDLFNGTWVEYVEDK